MEEDQSILDLVEKYEGKNQHIDFEEFWNYWKGELSDGSIVQYIRYLSHLDFDPTVEDPQPELLDEDTDFGLEDFKEWSREISRKRFDKSEGNKNTRDRFQYNVYLALKKYLKAKKENELLEKLPSANSFDKPTSKDQTIRYSEEQVQKMREVCENTTVDLSIVLMAQSGLRAYEVLNMTAEWLEFKDDRIEIRIPGEYAKGRKNNAKPEHAFLSTEHEQSLKQHIKELYDTDNEYQELLKEISEEGDYRPLFNYIDDSNKTFEDLHKERYQLNRLLKEKAKKAGLNNAESISAHKLRKSFIHEVQGQTNDLSKTAQLARHKDPSTTQEFYLQLDKSEQVETYKEVF
jgi:integrase